ncbi:hypothetical protein BDY19DRAFT_572934 [Irpex rosettiformis]|uniref:Uncharacterized protein n=1 Tax=Irpex rosettiformis TaxID=378272 RepID=A0ACB8UCF1_9APHY|nr:hypothetical protein BDY19DRAFT_572934 [Irpex rosettiformis]
MSALLPPDAVHKLKDTLGSVFVGFTLSTALWGVSILQVWLYFRNYPKDSSILKGLVGALWSIDSASTAFMAHTIYTYTVLNVTNPALDVSIPWSTVAQYAAVIWQVSKMTILTCIILLLAIVSFGTGLVTVIRLAIAPTIATTSEPTVLIVGSITQATGAACDILITASLIYFFRAKRNSFKRTGRILEQLITYAITRGTLTTLCQIFFLILLQKIPYKDAAFYSVFLQLVGKRT